MTYVVMEVSQSTFDEIKALLQKVRHEQTIHKDRAGRALLDMRGIAIGLASEGGNADESA